MPQSSKPKDKIKVKSADDETKANGTKEPDTRKRGWDEIESLFADKKKKAAAKAETSQKKKIPSAVKVQATKKKMGETDDWVDDGLGGVYNKEGFTGRVEDGVRIFKAHVIQQSPDAGNTRLCPFDCKCCYM